MKVFCVFWPGMSEILERLDGIYEFMNSWAFVPLSHYPGQRVLLKYFDNFCDAIRNLLRAVNMPLIKFKFFLMLHNSTI